MATEKPRFTITLDPKMLDDVLAYKKDNKLSTQSKAIQRLIEIGIKETLDSHTLTTFTPEELQLVSDYRELSPTGKEYIRQTIVMAKQSYSGKNDALPELENA